MSHSKPTSPSPKTAPKNWPSKVPGSSSGKRRDNNPQKTK